MIGKEKLTKNQKEIHNFLDSKPWLVNQNYRWPQTEFYFPCKPEDRKWDDENLPKYVSSTFCEHIFLEEARSNSYTWAFPNVAIKAFSHLNEHNQKTEIKIWFTYLRSGHEWEKVFEGFLKDVEELKQALRFIGIHENYITGDNTIPK